MRSKRRTTYLIKMCELAIRAGIEEHLRDESVTGLQYTVMSIVGRGKSLSVADLARTCRVTPQSMSELVRSLEQKGLLVRATDPANRRIMRISLTPVGQEMLTRCDRSMDHLERKMFGHLSAEELDQLRKSLERVNAGPGEE